MHFFDSAGTLGWGSFWMVLWWMLPILGIVALVTWIGQFEGDKQRKTVVDTLKERYARGEIGQEEFQRKKRELGE